MAYTSFPGPDETLFDLAWLHPEIYRSFEHGVFEAKTHFETKQIKYDGAAFSTFVRLHAKDYLSKRGLEAIDVEDVNLTGLSLRLDRYHIKMWKASEDGLPIPGKSEPKQAFYQQPLFTDGDSPEVLNLAVIWNTDASKNLSSIWLVCPKSGDEKSAEAHWNVRIPDPALAVQSSNSNPPTDDLPMVLKNTEDTKKKGNQRE